MDWTALLLSLKLAFWTNVVLLPLALWLARALAFGRWRGRALVEAAVALPLVLPPTVLGYYLLTAFGAASPLGATWQRLFGHGLAFSFDGLLVASVIANLPFAVQPMSRAFEALPPDLREAAWVSGLGPFATFWRIELPLAWGGMLTAFVLTFAHTIGEFGVVLMVGGGIAGETRTAALAIYDRVQAFDTQAAGLMSAALLALSAVAILIVQRLGAGIGRRHG